MEDPLSYLSPNPNPNSLMSDPTLISADDLPFSDEITGSDFPFPDAFDFTFDDLAFADDLLLEPPDSDDIGEVRVFGCESPEIDSCKSNSPISLRSGNVIVDNRCERDVDSSLDRNVCDRYVDSSDFDGYNYINSDNCDRDVISRSFDDDSKPNRNDCDRDVVSSDIDDHFDINGNNCGRDVISRSFDDNCKRNRGNCGRDVSLRAAGDDSERNRNNCGRDVSARPFGGDSRRSRKNCYRDVSARAVGEKMSENHSLSDSGDCNSKIKGGEVMIGSKVMAKRKKDEENVESESSGDGRTSKFRRSAIANSECESGGFNVGNDDDDDEKRKARLMRNRESAQLSRQRKKQYVEELEEKVRAMHSTISELNGKISYVMAENATLRQQLSGGATCPPPPVMYPMAPMGYPWMPMPCPPYMIKPQGSQVPLVPIPRLKPQQPVHGSKDGKKSESKKKNEGKTKKVASISFVGLLFFFLLFGGLVPMVNVRYGGVKDGFSGLQKGAVLMLDNYTNKMGNKGGSGIMDGKFHHGRALEQSSTSDVFGSTGNLSGPLVASLYVPRNDKMVKIDGNLIIHSVLASERARASHADSKVKTGEETSLAVARTYPPYPIPGPRSANGRHHHLDENSNGRQRALGSSSSEDAKSSGSDGPLQQWFREGLAGPMLSSGMCTEVFQFDVSPKPGSIVPSTSMSNATSSNRHNSTRPNKPRNRRILKGHPIPFDSRAFNLNDEHKQNAELNSNKSHSSMVVSVLVDPREAGDGDGEGVIRSKTLSRIFVVVLIDSVKYVTYSCMLPFVGPGNHLVTN